MKADCKPVKPRGCVEWTRQPDPRAHPHCKTLLGNMASSRTLCQELRMPGTQHMHTTVSKCFIV